MKRRESRELAFALLFEKSFTDDSLEEILTNAGEARDVNAGTFARELAEGTLAAQEEVDGQIRAASRNWSPERFSRTARTLMRLAVYEMTRTDVPVSVAINEAVELAKKYGGEEDASFVNGVLGGVARRLPKSENAAHTGAAKAEATAENGQEA